MQKTKTANGFYRFWAIVERATFTKAYARTLGAFAIRFRDTEADDDGNSLVDIFTRNEFWDEDAVLDEAVIDAGSLATSADKRPPRDNDSVRNAVKRTFDGTAPSNQWDASTNHSLYVKNAQWNLHALGLTTLNDNANQTDPATLPWAKPSWTAFKADGVTPLEGEGVVIGAITQNMPQQLWGWEEDEWSLHEAVHMYRDVSFAANSDAPAPAEYFTEDPNAGEVDLNGGVIGYSIWADTIKPSISPDQGTGIAGQDLPDCADLQQGYRYYGRNQDCLDYVFIKPGTVLIETEDGYVSITDTDNEDGTGSLSGEVSANALIRYADGALGTGTGIGDIDTDAVPTFSETIAVGVIINKFCAHTQPSQRLMQYFGDTMDMYHTAMTGIMMSDAVGSHATNALLDEIPNSKFETKGDVRGRIRGICPSAKLICYCDPGIRQPTSPVGFGFSIDHIVSSMMLALEHKVQIFILPFEPGATSGIIGFDGGDDISAWVEFYNTVLVHTVKRMEKAGILVIAPTSNMGLDDRNVVVGGLGDNWSMGESSHVLQVAGTAPRDYDGTDPELDKYSPTPGIEKAAEFNLDRVAQTGYASKFGVYNGFYTWLDYFFGFGSSPNVKNDVCAPSGSFDPEQARQILINANARYAPGYIDSGIPVTCSIKGGFFPMYYMSWYDGDYNPGGQYFVGPFGDGFGFHSFQSHTVLGCGHAAGIAALAYEKYKIENGAFPLKANKMRKLMMKTADSKVGPKKDFAFITASKPGVYVEPKYTLAFGPGGGSGDYFGIVPNDPTGGTLPHDTAPHTVLITGFSWPLIAWYGFVDGYTYYSWDHPADKNRGKDLYYGHGRISWPNLEAELE